jgi:hypothetical protein
VDGTVAKNRWRVNYNLSDSLPSVTEQIERPASLDAFSAQIFLEKVILGVLVSWW